MADYDRDWVDHVRDELIPKLRQTRMVVSLLPSGEIDVKFAVELGLAILLDKPLIVVVGPGSRVSRKLANVADEIVEADVRTEAGRDRLARVIEAKAKKR